MGTEGLNVVRDQIAAAASASGRAPSDIELVVVTKTRSDAEVKEIYDEGQRLFAENRQQGLASRYEGTLPHDITWHFIGHLQTRKAPFVATHAQMLQSLDSIRIARKWVAAGGGPVLVEFNIGNEPQKSGFPPDEPRRVLEEVLATGADVRGVMTIPPLVDDPGDAAPYFARLRSIFDALRAEHPVMDVCSMGMSHDFSVAIAEGATMIRVGRAIFENAHHRQD